MSILDPSRSVLQNTVSLNEFFEKNEVPIQEAMVIRTILFSAEWILGNFDGDHPISTLSPSAVLDKFLLSLGESRIGYETHPNKTNRLAA
jgi:hypothetical protein